MQDCQVYIAHLEQQLAAAGVGGSSVAYENSAADMPKESADSLPDWWSLPEQPKRKVRSDLLPHPDQATKENAHASPPRSGTWKRLSRVSFNTS